MKKVEGGYTLWARQTTDSEIFYNKPDKWFKIWFFIVSRVFFADFKKWNRGECFMTYYEIIEKTGATRDQIDKCIRWLKKCSMLATQKATRGMNIKVLNYDLFQDPESYESDTKSDTKAIQKRYKSDTITEEGKESKKNTPDNRFEIFWNKYDKKVDRSKTERKWKSISEKNKLLILERLDKYIKSTPDKKFRKNPMTWLNGECWNDEIQEEKKTKTSFNFVSYEN